MSGAKTGDNNRINETCKLKEKELSKMCSRILSSIDTVSKVVSCGEKTGEKFTVYDPPYVLEIDKNKITLKEKIDSEEFSEEVAVLTPEGIVFYRSYEDLKVLECWCVALTSMSFKRFVVKQQKSKEKRD